MPYGTGIVTLHSPAGTYHVEHHGAGVHVAFFKGKRARKPKAIATAGSLRGALEKISEHEGDVLEPNAPRAMGTSGPISIHAVGRRTTAKTRTQLDHDIEEFLAAHK